MSLKNFTKSMFFQYFKRYLQIHSILLLFGLGYAPLMYTIFGEHGRDVYYEGPRTLRYWLDNFIPIYWRNRCVQSSLKIAGSAWYSNSLTNVEFIFYCLFYLNYIVRRRFGHSYAFDFMAILVLAGVFLYVYNRHFEFDRFLDSNIYYVVGIACYYLRKYITEEPIGIIITERIFSIKSRTRILFVILCCYLWLVVSRINCQISMLFIWIPLVFDLFPNYRIKKFKLFFNEMKRLGMTIYISHFPFLYEATPRGWPEILPKDLNTINSISMNWLISWMLPLQHMLIAYPLWFLLRPLENFLPFFRDFSKNIKNAQKRRECLNNLVLGLLIIIVDLVLIILAQTDFYGHEKVALSRAQITDGYKEGYEYNKWNEP